MKTNILAVLFVIGFCGFSISQAEVVKSNKNTAKSISSTSRMPSGGGMLPPPSEISKKLYSALRAENFEMAEYLLQQGADINCRNCSPNGEPTLMLYRNHTYDLRLSPFLRWAGEHGANFNVPDNDGSTLLMMATDRRLQHDGAMEDIMYLLGHGAKVTVKSKRYGWTPMLYLTNRFAQPGWSDDYTQNMIKRYNYVAAKIIENGGNVNETSNDGTTPLMMASSQCSTLLARRLLAMGADPLLKNIKGETALDLAFERATSTSWKGCNETFTLLKNTGNTIQLQGSRESTTANFSENDWRGVFKATSPRSGSATVTASFSSSDNVTFSSSSGLRGAGTLTNKAGNITGSFIAKAPLDPQGKPIFGENEIKFDLTGTSSEGVMRGQYTSAIESGEFVICNKDAYQRESDCSTTNIVQNILAPIGAILKVLGGNK